MERLNCHIFLCDDAIVEEPPISVKEGGIIKSSYNEEVNNIAGVDFPAGDKQILGGAFALWNDMIDLYDNGISEYDCYKRLTSNMGLFAAKVWGKGNMTLKEAKEVSDFMGDAPNTNFGYEVETDGNYVVADWTEEEIAKLQHSANTLKGIISQVEI